VAALLLLDPLHEDSPKYWPEETQKGREQVTEMLGAELPEALVEAYRGVFRAKLRTWPEQIRESLIALHLAGWRTGVRRG
jgi:hypothetical protein